MDAIERANLVGTTSQAAERAALADGHELVGTDKQVEWARSLRAKVAGELAVMALSVRPEMADKVAEISAAILGETSAARWIEQRNLSARELFAARIS